MITYELERDVQMIRSEFGQLVQDDSTVETAAPKLGQVEPVVHHASACGATTGITIMVEVFGVSEHDITADEGKGFGQMILHAAEITAVEEIGTIHQHLQGRAADLVHQPSRLLRGVDDIVVLGLECERDADPLSRVRRRLDCTIRSRQASGDWLASLRCHMMSSRLPVQSVTMSVPNAGASSITPTR